MASKLIPITVTLSQRQPAALASTLDDLRAAGLEDMNVLEALGIATGKVRSERLDEVRGVPGVVVEIDEVTDIGPPDSPVS